MGKETVKIGIVLDGLIAPLWVDELLKRINNDHHLEIKLLVFCQRKRSNRIKKPFLYRIYEAMEHMLFWNFTAYTKKKDISDEIKDVVNISFEEDIKEISMVIQAYRLDVILNLSSYLFEGSHLYIAKHGVWNYCVEYQNPIRTNSNLYRKVVQKEPVVKASVKCINGIYETTSVIYSSWLATNFHSVFLTYNPVLALGAVSIYRLLKGIYLYGDHYIESFTLKYNERAVHECISGLWPGNWTIFINFFKILSRYTQHKITTQSKTKWYLMFKLKSTPFPKAINGYKYLLPPIGKFWADPFVLSKKNKNYVFIEELPFKTNKGYISLLELDKSGSLLKSERILEQPYHMSYPFVFEYQNEYYMLPETSQNKTIELYKCVKFPEKWTFVMTLMDEVNAKDTTLYYYRNKWWMFTAINESSGNSEHLELFLFYSDQLFSKQWIPHIQNPIVSDIRNARSAGKIFKDGDNIYRPSQDCSERYGKAININQIVELDELSFKEIPVTKFEANWNSKLKGTHTFNFDENFTVIDVY